MEKPMDNEIAPVMSNAKKARLILADIPAIKGCYAPFGARNDK